MPGKFSYIHVEDAFDGAVNICETISLAQCVCRLGSTSSPPPFRLADRDKLLHVCAITQPTRPASIQPAANSSKSTAIINRIGLLVALCLPSAGFAESASIYDYRLGEHIIDYPLGELEVIAYDPNGFGGQSIIKVNGVGSTEVVLTFRLPQSTLQYIEHDWLDSEATAETALSLHNTPEFIFGRSRIADVQAALGDEGFHYACRQSQVIPEGMLTFVSFEITERPEAIYTFVFEYSRDLAERGLLDDKQFDLAKAVLVATIVARPDYAVDFWCSDTVPYTSNPVVIPEAFDFVPSAATVVPTEPWEVITEPFFMIAKNGSITYGDRLHIAIDPTNCTAADFMIWAHTYEDEALLSLEGQEVSASFNVIGSNRERAPLRSPLILDDAMFAPINEGDWPPFAIGRFFIGSFDFAAISDAEAEPRVLGFSLEFQADVAGMIDNYWTLEGLEEAASQVLMHCREGQK
jgi:hypothetical protein